MIHRPFSGGCLVRSKAVWGLVLALGATIGCAPPERPAGENAPSSAPKVLLLALDGVAWDYLDPVLAAGDAPALAGLRARSAWGPLTSMLPSRSPVLWTTVATGKWPEEHGIHDFFVTDPADGEPKPIVSSLRRARTFWDILSEAGYSNLIVNWWNTWPAEPIRGALVSDYLFFSRNALENGAEVDREKLLERATYPADLAARIVPQLERARVLPASVVQAVLPFDAEETDAFIHQVDARLGEQRSADALSVLKNKLIESEFHRDVILDLAGERHFDLVCYYTKAIDATGHMFWTYREPDAPVYADDPPPPELAERFGPTVDRVVAYEDRNLAELLRLADENTYVLVVSDHGHRAGGHEDGPDGMFLLAGPGVVPGPVDGIGLEDVAPLLLYLFDVPVGEDMVGEVPLACFDGPLNGQEVRRVATHERERVTAEAQHDSTVAATIRAELQSLGYVE